MCFTTLLFWFVTVFCSGKLVYYKYCHSSEWQQSIREVMIPENSGNEEMVSVVCLGVIQLPKSKHLSLQDRMTIENMLNQHFSFKEIGIRIGKDCTTVSKEIRKHRTIKESGGYGRRYNPCIHRNTCAKENLCEDISCKARYCCRCTRHLCFNLCPSFTEELCSRLELPPYVCNSCPKLSQCTLKKKFYSSVQADREYKELLSDTRSGISTSPEELERLDMIISPLINQGQSIHHICINHADEIMLDEKTIYNYISNGLFSTCNLDLPRKVRYRLRKKKKEVKIDKSCRTGRTYRDFENFMEEHPDFPIVEMDSVEGTKGGKVLLTIHFCTVQLMLAFLREHNTAASVTSVFDEFYTCLGVEKFRELFPVILTDNGSEFSNPGAIEFDSDGNRRTYVFYCDPSAPYQKGSIENNHELIRRIIPKGASLNSLCQDDINLMMDHINSYGRKKLNNRSPYQSFSFYYGEEILRELRTNQIPADHVTLNPKLLKL